MTHPQDVAIPSLPEPDCTYADHSYPAYSRKAVERIVLAAIAAIIADRAAGRASAEPEGFQIALHEWAVAGWRSEVQNRPLVNIHRKRLEGVHDFVSQPSTEDSLNAMAARHVAERAAPKAEGEAVSEAMKEAEDRFYDPRRFYAQNATVAQAAAGASEHLEEIRAVLQGAHTIMESLAAIEKRVGPVGSHARGYTHKITNALKHLDALARPEADADRASGGGAPEWYDAQDEVALTRAVSVMNDVLSDIAGWEDKELEDAVKDSKIDLMAMIECIRMNADDTYVPGSKPIDGETFGATPTTKD